MKLIALTILTLSAVTLYSCKDVGDNNANIHNMEDSLFKAYPTVNRVSVEVKDYADVIVTLGDAELYNQPQKHQQITDQIGQMAVHFFDKDNYLDKATVHFVQEENTLEVKEGTAKTYDVNLKDLKK